MNKLEYHRVVHQWGKWCAQLNPLLPVQMAHLLCGDRCARHFKGRKREEHETCTYKPCRLMLFI